MSRRSAIFTAPRSTPPNRSRPTPRAFSDHRKLLEMKEVDAVLIGVPDHWHAVRCHRCAQRGQGRVRGEAADPEDRGGSAHRQGRARQQSHLPGGHAAALRQALPGSQGAVHGHRQTGQGHAGAHLVARQRLPSAQGAGSPQGSARPTWIGRISWDRSSGATGIRSSIGTGAPTWISAAAR